MSDPRPQTEVTQILEALTKDDPTASDRLLPIIYKELRSLAGHIFADMPPGHTLQPTALVHDVYLRLAGNTNTEWQGRSHFMAVAAKAMRRILIDHARKKYAEKRGGKWQRITLSGLTNTTSTLPIDILDLEEALTRLGEVNERQARTVELRFFAGLKIKQVAHVLGVSERTVKNDWRIAQAWLRAQLEVQDP